MENLRGSSTLNTLSKAIVFGQELLEEIVTKEKMELEQLVIISLYRKLLEQLDGAFILADHKSDSALKVIIRSSLETYLALSYILQKKKFIKDRAVSYYIGYIISQKKSAEFGLQNLDRGFPKEIMEAELKRANEVLRKDEYKRILDKWEEAKKKSRYNFEPKWYSLFNGPTSIKQLIKTLEKDDEQYRLYGLLSTEAHGYQALNAIYSEEKSLLLKPLRGGIAESTENLARAFCTTSTKNIVANIFPSYEKKVSAFYKENRIMPLRYYYTLE